MTRSFLHFERPTNHSDKNRLFSTINNGVKRLFDIFAAAFGIILISPIILVIATLIKRDSPGPVFYRGPRVGKNGKVFGILKFRTMHEDPESYNGPRVTAQDDPRVTPLGRWLRDTKLNELPQFWNVLVGDMSMVGPRPEDPEIAASWDPAVRAEVLSVRPGITSPASVLYRNEETLLQADQVMATYLDSILPSKLRLDQLYVRHRSFWLDLDILLWTFLVLLPQLGNYSPPEENLFLGPVSQLVRRYVSWFTIDTVVTFIAIGITGLVWRSFGPLDVGWPKAIAAALGFALIFSLVGAILGVNRISWSNSGALDALDLLPAVGIATLVTFLINWFWPPFPLLPPPMVLMAAGVAFIGYVMIRYRGRLVGGLVWRWLSIRGKALSARERVLIVGGGEAGQFMAWLLHSARGSDAFRAVGFIDDDLYKQGTRIQGLPVIGRRADIPLLVARHDIGLIIFAIHNIPLEERAELLEFCASTPAQVVVMPDILGILDSVMQQSPENKPKGQVYEPFENLIPCEFCLSRATPLKLGSWLTELETSAQAGDLKAITDQIEALRNQLRPHSGSEALASSSTAKDETRGSTLIPEKGS